MYNKNVDKIDIKYRYYDWVFTTPIMLLNTIVYFEYNNGLNEKTNNNSSNDTPLTIENFIKDNLHNVGLIFLYNL